MASARAICRLSHWIRLDHEIEDLRASSLDTRARSLSRCERDVNCCPPCIGHLGQSISDIPSLAPVDDTCYWLVEAFEDHFAAYWRMTAHQQRLDEQAQHLLTPLDDASQTHTSRSTKSPRRNARRAILISLCALVVLLIASLSTAHLLRMTSPSPSASSLSFTSSGTFQISIFEDLHFGESRLQRRSLDC